MPQTPVITDIVLGGQSDRVVVIPPRTTFRIPVDVVAKFGSYGELRLGVVMSYRAVGTSGGAETPFNLESCDAAPAQGYKNFMLGLGQASASGTSGKFLGLVGRTNSGNGTSSAWQATGTHRSIATPGSDIWDEYIYADNSGQPVQLFNGTDAARRFALSFIPNTGGYCIVYGDNIANSAASGVNTAYSVQDLSQYVTYGNLNKVVTSSRQGLVSGDVNFFQSADLCILIHNPCVDNELRVHCVVLKKAV